MSAACGPSPRAWGQRSRPNRHHARSRSIPTGVGTTLAVSLNALGWAVHPHGRGDNYGLLEISAHAFGPSPRAWGQLFGRPALRAPERSIPTGVGTTIGTVGAVGAVIEMPYGPSPRAWGQRRRQSAVHRVPRSIPTGVGTTSPCSFHHAAPSVHPHGRGDNLIAPAATKKASGPSPRAWGQRKPITRRTDP